MIIPPLRPVIQSAANLVIERGAAKVILIGDKNEIVAKANELGFNNIEKATFINPISSRGMLDKLLSEDTTAGHPQPYMLKLVRFVMAERTSTGT